MRATQLPDVKVNPGSQLMQTALLAGEQAWQLVCPEHVTLEQAPLKRVMPEAHSVQVNALLQKRQLVIAEEQRSHVCPLMKYPSKQMSQKTEPVWTEHVRQLGTEVSQD